MQFAHVPCSVKILLTSKPFSDVPDHQPLLVCGCVILCSRASCSALRFFFFPLFLDRVLSLQSGNILMKGVCEVKCLISL